MMCYLKFELSWCQPGPAFLLIACTQCNQLDSLVWLCDQETHKSPRWKPLPKQKSIITQFLVIQSGDKKHPCANKNTGELHWDVSWAPDACLHSLSPAVLYLLPLLIMICEAL